MAMHFKIPFIGWLRAVFLGTAAVSGLLAQEVSTSGSAAPEPTAPAVETVPAKQSEKQSATDKQKKSADSIFTGLVLATNTESPGVAGPELQPLFPRLKRIFGYNHFELLGSHTEVMDNPDERWLVPSKIFSLSIKSKQESDTSYLVNFQLFQESKMLAEFKSRVGADSPIFIRGPLYGNGQLVIVISVR